MLKITASCGLLVVTAVLGKVSVVTEGDISAAAAMPVPLNGALRFTALDAPKYVIGMMSEPVLAPAAWGVNARLIVQNCVGCKKSPLGQPLPLEPMLKSSPPEPKFVPLNLPT